MRTVIVDDSASYRKILRNALGQIEGIEIIAELASGRELIERIEDLEPELITLDIEMPELNGIEVLEALAPVKASTAILVVASQSSSEQTLRALKHGALEVIAKPTTADSKPKKELVARLKHGIAIARARSHPAPPLKKRAPIPKPGISVSARSDRVQGLIVLGVSTGGPEALEKVVDTIDSSLETPILIVQHMPKGFTSSLADALASRCAIEVSESKAGDVVKPGRILLAAGGQHMEVGRDPTGGLIVRQVDSPPVRGCRPAVDRLFLTVGKHFQGPILAVIMTGMGDDGLEGMRVLREKGAHCICQDQATSVVFGMPRAVVEAGLVDEVLPLGQIGPKINEFDSSIRTS
ncbi:MAG: chemotaxis-specific protein-glutamate methyltransferase CheB [bacterium]|nr:chemotaxis-specific protein-glutamate methyltransferase CheB [bacterium]